MDNHNDAWNEFYDEYKKQNKSRRTNSVEKAYERLLTQYRASVRRKSRKLPALNNTRLEVDQCLDLLGAIFEYRKCPNMDEYLMSNEAMVAQTVYVEQLWAEFNKNTPDEMYDLISSMMVEIEGHLGDQYD